MLFLAGLGNHGSSYMRHRHNVGFRMIDAVMRHHQFPPAKKSFRALTAEAVIDDVKICALKPQTFMNKSGDSVGMALRFFKMEASHLYVIHDDLDLQCGRIKVKCGGGTGGHRGLRSLDEHIGIMYHRLRIGIGRPGEGMDVSSYVLHDFAKEDETWLQPLEDAVARHLPLWFAGDNDEFIGQLREAIA